MLITCVHDPTCRMAIIHPRSAGYGLNLQDACADVLMLRWDARWHAGRVYRSLQFELLIKTANRSDFYSPGNVYFETPNNLKKLYPEAKEIDVLLLSDRGQGSSLA